jgi:hypothetical protein
MTSRASRDWRVVLLAVVAGAGALLCLGLAFSIAGYGIVEPWLRPLAVPGLENEDISGLLSLAGGMVVVAGVLIATLLAAIDTLRGPAHQEFQTKPMQWWAILIWTLVWITASVLAQTLREGASSQWAAPLFQLVAIASPIYVFARIAIGGIPGGSRLGLWGSVSAGMLVGTGIAATLEIALLLVAIGAGGAYLLANPHQLIAAQQLVRELTRLGNPDESLALLAPIITSPLALALALAAVALATPVIEELAKSVAIWAQYGRLSAGAHGFWVGALSGAGFALFEGIMVSSSAGEGLAAILMLRAGSSLMHILACGLAGWGIAVFRETASASRMLAGYAAAIGVHATWNAVVVTIGYGGLRTTYIDVQPDPVGLLLSVTGAMILVMLIGLLPIALLSLNLHFRGRDAAAQTTDPGGGVAQFAAESDRADEVP